MPKQKPLACVRMRVCVCVYAKSRRAHDAHTCEPTACAGGRPISAYTCMRLRGRRAWRVRACMESLKTTTHIKCVCERTGIAHTKTHKQQHYLCMHTRHTHTLARICMRGSISHSAGVCMHCITRGCIFVCASAMHAHFDFTERTHTRAQRTY